MEIERKYLVKTLPDHLDQYESKKIPSNKELKNEY